MMLIGVCIDSSDDSTSLIRHPFSHRPFASGRLAGTGGHNSDEALAANRFLSSHDRPDRPPKAARNRGTRRDRHVPSTTLIGQFESRSDLVEHPDKILTVRKLSG